MEELTAQMANDIMLEAYKRKKVAEEAELAEQEKKDQECLAQPHIQNKLQEIFNEIRRLSNECQNSIDIDTTINPTESEISMEEYIVIIRHLKKLGYTVVTAELKPSDKGAKLLSFKIKWLYGL
ncbi:MAG: hypothetical protein IJV56_08390 [Neisseriaceae bacterium]|nr:hypothetical protein [Bacteroidales bacterium]MBQ9725339.1 hypothetical protein [Neisseriaceae bacterium]